jgi:hypothetical protein
MLDKPGRSVDIDYSYTQGSALSDGESVGGEGRPLVDRDAE